MLAIVNFILCGFGFQLIRRSRSAMDMESVVRITANMAGDMHTVIDIGAASGHWSKMAMRHFATAKFIGIEPLVEREPELSKLRAVDPRFDYVLCVAGQNDDETVELTVSDDLDGSTVGGRGGIARRVPSQSVDGIVKMKQCSGPFLVKFDTHGFELAILNGAQKTLEDTTYIIMETYNYRHTSGTLLFYEMCEHLDRLGFRCFNLADPMQRPFDKSLWQMDLFFARKDNKAFDEDSFNGPKCTNGSA